MDANNTINTTITPDAIDGTAAASIASAAGAYAQFAMQAASLVAGQDGQLVLPEGVSLSDIRVSGRNLIVRMPDGSEVVIEDGAIVIPQFVVDGVAIPAINLAALLVGQEPAPAAGPTQSSGGNFEQDPGTIGDPFGLGDLLPPTQLAFSDPQPEEQLPGLIDRDPDVNIQDGGPAGKDVTDNVSEVGLPGTRTNGNVESPGSSAGNGSDSTTGFIIVNSPDGIASITINGTTYTGVAGQQIVTANGVLTLGVLSGDQIPYTYRLTDNTSGDSTTDVFTVVLTDPDGDTSTARLTIVIADDVPTARADTDSIAGGAYGPESGNVLTGTGTTSGATGADTLGADGAAVSGFRAGASGSFAAVGTTIAGQYGTLTLGANGSYTYVRNPNTPGGVSDVFTYQITDGDGDASTATLTINIGDAPNRITFVPEIGEGTEVRESHLPARDGEPSGSQFDGNSETTTGTITFTSPDGVASVTVSGVTLTPGSLPQTVVSNATGTLVVTGYTYNPTTGVGSITYTYTLNDNTLNTTGSTVSFPVVVTDLDGDAASDQLDIRIVDDVPTAANDADSIAAGQYGPATGNVITDAEGDGGADVKGADNATVTAVSGAAAGTVGGSTAGQYGVLTLNADGSYSYVRNAGTPGGVTDVFSYTITDGDGDPSTATLTISIADALPLTGANATVLLDDDALAGGNAGGTGDDANSANTSGTLSASGGDGPLAWALNTTGAPAGFSYVANGTGIDVFQGATKVLAITLNTATGAYTVSQIAPIVHANGGNENNQAFSLSYTVTDQDGDTAGGTLSIDVDDDSPIALTATTSGTVDEDGLANGIGGGTDDVAGTATTATGSVTGLFSAGADSPLTYSLSSNTAGLPALTSGGVALSYTVVGNLLTASAGATQVFTLSLNATTGAWTFTLLAKLDHPAGNNENDIALQFGGLIIATDKDGDSVTATGNLTVIVDDDTPTAANDTDAVTEDGPTVANGNVLTGVGSDGNAAGTDALGADGPAVGGAVTAIAGGTIGAARAGSYGSLTLNADGSYTYTLSNSNALVQGLDTGETLTDVFTYTITDRDGDSTTATLTITINGTNDAPVVTPSTVSVSEEGLAGGNADSTGTTDTTNLAANGGTIVATDVDGEALTYTLGNPGAVLTSGGLAVTWTGVGTGTLTGRVETSPGMFANVITVTIDSSGNYTVTLLDQVDHAGINVEDLKTFTVPVSVSDGTATTNTNLTVNIEDDSPVLVGSATNITLTGSSLSGSGTFDYTIGADSRTSFSSANTDLAVALSGTVGSGAIVSPTVTWASETSSTATFNFTFQYDSDPTSASNPLTTETGSIVFNKDAGTYTVTLNEPIATYSTSTTSATISSTGYDIAGGPQTEVVVSLLSTTPTLYVQFSGYQVTSGGSGVPMTSGGNTAYVAGETLTAAQTYVSISGTANGVGSDTIQSGEILDFDFFSTDPGSNLAAPTNTFATGMYLKLDGYGTEDLVVILKLADPNNPGVVLTTRAIVVDAADVFKAGSVPAGYNVTLDGNDGLIVIESNDYRDASDSVQYVIVGAQLVSSTGTITGSGINLNGAVGSTGGSTNLAGNLITQAFGPSTVDTDVVKISDIGITQVTTSTQTVRLNFDVTVTDTDGDSTTTTRLSVNPLTPPVAIDLDGDGVEFVSTAAGVAFDYAGDGNPESTAWVGADDGLLAIDSNGNGLVDNGSEIVFGGNGLTDLQGLAANYDSNKDGVLDANDADFAKFGVWQDANSNGVTDAGEFRSLTDAGITSINLVSDGVEYAAANGEVTVHGTSSYTKADGTTGEVADASFATAGESKVAANENDQRVLASANTGMASSLVAAGLVAAIAGAGESANNQPEQLGGSDFAVRTVAEDMASDTQFDAPDHNALFKSDSGSSSFEGADLIDTAKFSSYDQVEDHADANFGGFGEMDSGSLLSDLLASTEIEHANFAQTGFAIGSHVDAASEALIAIQQGDMFAKAAIEEVVADALAGGFGEGANVDALLNALAGPANDTLLLGDTLAQQFGDHPAFEALNFAAANDMLDQLASTHMELSAATGQHG